MKHIITIIAALFAAIPHLAAQRFIRGVDSLSALASTPVSTVSPDIYVTGGNGGFFKWDSTSTASTNAFNVIANPYGAGSGRWIRQPAIGGTIEQASFTTGTNVLNALLIGWAASGSWTLTSATRDTNSVITSATIRWPDGATGAFTTTSNNPTFFTVDAYTATHSTSGKTLTQSAVTRNAQGDITAQPAITISP